MGVGVGPIGHWGVGVMTGYRFEVVEDVVVVELEGSAVLGLSIEA